MKTVSVQIVKLSANLLRLELIAAGGHGSHAHPDQLRKLTALGLRPIGVCVFR